MKSSRVVRGMLVGVLCLMGAEIAGGQYHPNMGRFLQRDPLGVRVGQAVFVNGAPRIVGTSGPRAGGGVRPDVPEQVRVMAEMARVNRVNAINRARAEGVGGSIPYPADPAARITSKSGIDPVRQYGDGMNLYQYCLSNPVIGIDPLGLCTNTLKFVGHGMSTKCDVDKKSLAKDKCIPEFMSKGIGEDATMLVVDDIRKECKSLCCNATLKLYACGIGKNSGYMKSLASGCTKIKKVCGYTRGLRYIPGTSVTLPMPWRWNCINVN